MGQGSVLTMTCMMLNGFDITLVLMSLYHRYVGLG
uniref:Uncharacterized protein n=1 Tax=Anguilla anguilla TaxID=7936 RepID=A0A0E9SG56_ANGAN